MVPTIVHNAKILAKVIEKKTGDRRLGDQYGALMSGYLSLCNTNSVTEEDAKWIIDDIKFDNEKENANGINDQHRLLNKILQHIVRVPRDKGFEEITIAEMCLRVHNRSENNAECKISLGNIGIKVFEHGDELKSHVAIANDNDNLAEILKGSNWPDNWHQTLKRITFAQSSETNIYFSPGCKVRAVILPIDQITFEDI